LFVIINNNVLSAASNFVAIIKDSRRGVVVGEETGGGYNSHNGFTRVLYKLPATGFSIEYSVVQVKHALQNPNLNKFGILPDYHISTTVHDVIESRDPQLSFIINKLIKPSMQ
jgi:C-terminal processing protease CtpA/Prc